MAQTTKKSCLDKNVLLAMTTWFVVVLLIRIAGLFEGIAFIRNNLSVISAVLLLYPPVIISIFLRKKISYWHINTKTLKKDFLILVYVCLIIFPLAFVLNHFYQVMFCHTHYHVSRFHEWWSCVLVNLIVIAFPEEFFFRGFLETTLLEKFPAKKYFFGAPTGGVIIFVSMLFAVSHSLINVQWWHVFIFFPALVFSWLRQKTGSIWMSVLFHALCNIFAQWVWAHYY